MASSQPTPVQIRPVELHLDYEINAATTTHPPPFSILSPIPPNSSNLLHPLHPLPAACVFVFLAVFQNILVTFCELHFNMRFVISDYKLQGRTSKTALSVSMI